MKKIHYIILIIVVLVLVGVGMVELKKLKVNEANSDLGISTTTSGEIAPASPISITQADNNKIVHIKEGSRFSLSLGEMDWSLNISDPGIISRVKNIMVLRGSQGVYTADKVGETIIAAEGRPICNPGEMCAQYIVNFSVTVVVEK